MKKRQSGAEIRVQLRTGTRMRTWMKDDVEPKEILVGIEDMMERKEYSSRKTRWERSPPSGRWTLMRKLDSEEEKKNRRMPREKIER
jgi:hypothetical protein